MYKLYNSLSGDIATNTADTCDLGKPNSEDADGEDLIVSDAINMNSMCSSSQGLWRQFWKCDLSFSYFSSSYI